MVQSLFSRSRNDDDGDTGKTDSFSPNSPKGNGHRHDSLSGYFSDCALLGRAAAGLRGERRGERDFGPSSKHLDSSHGGKYRIIVASAAAAAAQDEGRNAYEKVELTGTE